MERWTWDGTCRTGYVHVNSDLAADRQVDISEHGFVVDVDRYGRIVGVEVVYAANPVDMLSRLAGLLEYCRYVD
jgi:uncharacterized protein YuzE